MIDPVNDQAANGRLQFGNQDCTSFLRIVVDSDTDVQQIIVTVTMGIVTLAKKFPIPFVGQLWIVKSV